MRRLMLFSCAVAAVACTPPTSPSQRAANTAAPAPTSLELVMRPGAPRSYTLTLRDRAALERRGPGAGRAHFDVAARVQLKRHDEPAPEGLRVNLAFSDVDARSYGPLGVAAARALKALGGAKVVVTVDGLGVVKALAYEGAVVAKVAAERLARTFLKMSPAFSTGGRAIGGRWGDSATLPVEVPGAAEPVNAVLQANYVYQRQGEVNGQPCAVVQLDMKPSGNTPVERMFDVRTRRSDSTETALAPTWRGEGAVTTTGSGQGELCIDTASGALRFGSFDLSLKTEVGTRRTKSPRVRGAHLEETRRIRLDITEGGVAG